MAGVVPRAERIHHYARFTVLYAAFVIYAGAMVTSTGSGMAVPDWPKSFGTWTPKMEGGVFFEHGHRAVAGALGLLVLGLALWAAAVERRPRARLLVWAALVAVVIQAGLGGITVLWGTANGWSNTHPVISMLHACLAQLLFVALVTYAVVSAPGWRSTQRRPVPAGLAGQGVALVALVYLQIILGAAMRQQHAGLIIGDFPLSYGKIIPTFHNGLVALNFSHRVGGWLLFVVGGIFAWRVGFDRTMDPWVRAPARVFLAAVFAQFFLGASAVWTHLTLPWLTSFHVVGGSVVFASSAALALRLRHLSRS